MTDLAIAVLLGLIVLAALAFLALMADACRDNARLRARQHTDVRRRMETLAYHSTWGHPTTPDCAAQGCWPQHPDFELSPSRRSLDAQIVAFDAAPKLVDDIAVYLNEFRP